MLLLCFAAPPLRDNNAHIRHASPIANSEILVAPVLEFIEYKINIEFLLRFKPRFLLSNPSMQEIPRLKLRPHNNPLPKAFRIWPPCTTRYSGASSGLQRSASELYRLLSAGSLESSGLGVAPRHTRSAGLTIWDCQSLSYDYQLDNHIVPTFSIGTELDKSCGSLNGICATTKLVRLGISPCRRRPWVLDAYKGIFDLNQWTDYLSFHVGPKTRWTMPLWCTLELRQNIHTGD